MRRAIRRLAVLIALACAATRAGAAAAPAGPEDYLRVLANGPWPLEMLAYCYGSVGKDPTYQEVAARWRQRNGGLLAGVEARAAGIVPADVRQAADEASLAAIRALVGRQYDKPAWCRMMAAIVDGGAYDIDRRSDLEAALKRIFGRD